MNYQEEVTANPFRLKMVGFEVPFHGRLWVPGDKAEQPTPADPQDVEKVVAPVLPVFAARQEFSAPSHDPPNGVLEALNMAI